MIVGYTTYQDLAEYKEILEEHRNVLERFLTKWRKQMKMNGLWYVSKSQGTGLSDHLCGAPGHRVTCVGHRGTGSPMLGTYAGYWVIGLPGHRITGLFIQCQ